MNPKSVVRRAYEPHQNLWSVGLMNPKSVVPRAYEPQICGTQGL